MAGILGKWLMGKLASKVGGGSSQDGATVTLPDGEQIQASPARAGGQPASAGAPSLVESLRSVGLEPGQAEALARQASADPGGAATDPIAAQQAGAGPVVLGAQAPAAPQMPQRREPPPQFVAMRQRLDNAGGQIGARLSQLRQGGLSQEEAIAQAADEGMIDPRLARHMLGISQAGR